MDAVKQTGDISDLYLDDVFICVPCDTRTGITKGKHLETHTLVLCQTQASKEAPPTIEQRIDTVESRLETVNCRLEGVEAQLTRIQEMLESVLLRQASSSSNLN